MALPSGRFCTTRPDRQFPRKFNAKDCGRVVKYALQAGEDEKEICLQIAIKSGLDCGECNYEKITTLIGITLTTIALLAAVRSRNREAIRLAREAIAKAQSTSRQQIGRIELEKVDSYLLLMDSSDKELDDSLDRLTQLLVESKSEIDQRQAQVTIIQPEE